MATEIQRLFSFSSYMNNWHVFKSWMTSLLFKFSNKKEAEATFDYKNERMSAFVLKFDGPTNLERIIAIILCSQTKKIPITYQNFKKGTK